MAIQSLIKQYPLASFVVLYSALSLILLVMPFEGEGAFILLLTVLAIAPALLAIVITAIEKGRRGVIELMRLCLQWRYPLKWYGIVVFIGFLMNFGASVLALLTGRISSIAFNAPTVFLLILILWALVEEIGLRGFLLERLLERHSPVVATLIVSVPWALVHFALVTLFPPDGRSAIAEGISVFAGAIFISWIFIKSGHSVLVATVGHWAFNVFGSVTGIYNVLPESEAFWFFTLSTCLVSVVLIAIDWKLWFAQPAVSKLMPIQEANPLQV